MFLTLNGCMVLSGTYTSKGVATIEATQATASVKVSALSSIACNSLDFQNLYYHAIDMLKFSQCLGEKYTLATPLTSHTSLSKRAKMLQQE